MRKAEDQYLKSLLDKLDQSMKKKAIVQAESVNERNARMIKVSLHFRASSFRLLKELPEKWADTMKVLQTPQEGLSQSISGDNR